MGKAARANEARRREAFTIDQMPMGPARTLALLAWAHTEDPEAAEQKLAEVVYPGAAGPRRTLTVRVPTPGLHSRPGRWSRRR